MTQKQVAGWDGHPQFVANFCITGGKENYVFVIDNRSALTGLKAGLFYDLSKFPKEVIDFSKPKWASGSEKMLTKGSSFYAMRPLAPEPRGGVFFNKRLLEEAGIKPDLPYDLQKEGKWTWETFEQLLKQCTYDSDNDGVIDHWGMANSSTEFAPLAVMSNGTVMIGKDANGKFVNNVGTDQCLEALEWCAHLATHYEMPQPEGSEWNWMYPAFINGEVAFQVDQEYKAQTNGEYAAMADDYGFVCFPLGPKGDGKYKTLHNDNLYVIPSCYDDERATKIAKAFDFWSDETPGYDSPDSWKEGFYPSFRDDRAVDETLALMRAEPNPRYDTLIPGINYMGDVIWVTYPGYVTPQQAYEDTKNVWAGLLKDANR
jgi:ABC-type glycerol-3-phosphate transport system substrate-binding protein